MYEWRKQCWFIFYIYLCQYSHLICQHLSLFRQNSTFYLKPIDQNDWMSPFKLIVFLNIYQLIFGLCFLCIPINKHLLIDFQPWLSLYLYEYPMNSQFMERNVVTSLLVPVQNLSINLKRQKEKHYTKYKRSFHNKSTYLQNRLDLKYPWFSHISVNV